MEQRRRRYHHFSRTVIIFVGPKPLLSHLVTANDGATYTFGVMSRGQVQHSARGGYRLSKKRFTGGVPSPGVVTCPRGLWGQHTVPFSGTGGCSRGVEIIRGGWRTSAVARTVQRRRGMVLRRAGDSGGGAGGRQNASQTAAVNVGVRGHNTRSLTRAHGTRRRLDCRTSVVIKSPRWGNTTKKKKIIKNK